jgi:transposase
MTTAPSSAVTAIGVGIDTSRYGHHVSFLRDDLQPATEPLTMTESREGYDKLLSTLRELSRRYPNVEFQIRLDEAGQYAANLKTFLFALPFEKTVSIGDCVRNKNYRVAHFPKRKSDSVDSLSVARYAVREQPQAAEQIPLQLGALRDVASRLEAQAREVTRHLNQLHNVLARVFPEFDPIVRDLGAHSALELLRKYPTPVHLARSRLTSLAAIPRLRANTAGRLHEAAQTSIGSLTGPVAETIVRTVVDQVRFAQKLKCQYEKLLVESYRSLPVTNQLASINGFGEITAAVLTAKIVSIDRFDRPEQLVGYFGIFPEEKSSGIGPDGAAHPRRKTRMCQKGDDLVRRYLFNAALSAVQSNPAVRALYRRLRARGASGKVALGHAMRKLLHLAFAVWKSGKPFDPQYYPWDQTPGNLTAETKEAAGHKQEASPVEQVVTATPTATLSPPTSDVNTLSSGVDFQSVRSQTSMQQVLELLEFDPVEARGDQLRGACPVHHSTSPSSRSFSANLTTNTFRCFKCQAQGNHLDLWAAATNQKLYDAAIDLCQKVHIETPRVTLVQHRNPTGEEEPVSEPVVTARNSQAKPASSRLTPIDKSS